MHDACVSLIGQVYFVYPGKRKTLQEIALFFFGGLFCCKRINRNISVRCTRRGLCKVLAVSALIGQVISAARVDLQCWHNIMLSYRYHCL